MSSAVMQEVKQLDDQLPSFTSLGTGKNPKGSKGASIGTPIWWNSSRVRRTVQLSNVRAGCGGSRLHQEQLALGKECTGLCYAFLQFFSRPPCFGNDCFGFACKSSELVHWHRAVFLPQFLTKDYTRENRHALTDVKTAVAGLYHFEHHLLTRRRSPGGFWDGSLLKSGTK
jgi:hypothetical protein